MIRPVLRYGERVLQEPAAPVPAIGADTHRLIDDMIETMHEYHGVGLAAPQVHELLRVVVARVGTDGPDQGGEPPALVIINPEIRPVGSETIDDWEGCLSIPDLRGRVPRAAEIQVRGLDRRGERMSLRAIDFAARVIQHEADHLDGILFLDRMKSLETITFLEEYSRFWSKEEAPAE